MQPITLTSGMRANLVNLQNTNMLLEVTQKRLASGKKVNTALDDPVAYFTALGHEQRASDLASRKDEMSEAVQTIKAADAGIQSINTLIAAAKSLAQSALSAEATGAGLDTREALREQFEEVLDQIDSMAGDSGYKGINLLSVDTATTVGALEVYFDEDGVSKLQVLGFDATTSALGVETPADDGWEESSAIRTSVDQLTDAVETLRTESAKLANNLSIITARQEFTQNMVNVLKDGAAELTNADMNEEGANMLMLQTRQALGTTSLSLASQAAQSVLRLF
jgi:flagellin-like hook-associated protein FlgL